MVGNSREREYDLETEGKKEHITGPLYNKMIMSSTRARWPDRLTSEQGQGAKVKYGTWSSGGGHHHVKGARMWADDAI